LGRAAATERLPESDWQAELHATDIERLRFLPAAHRVGGSVAAWDARLARELDAMRAAGYVVLLHLPRSALLRAPATLQHCDGVCLAVRLGEFRASELTAAAAAITQCGGRLAACAALAAA
jgi:hypothetical protein